MENVMTREESFTDANMTDNNSTIDLYVIHPVKDILIATFVPVFLISLTGNLLVVYVIVRNRSMHTVTNFFLLNLAISDLLVTLCCIIPTLLWFIQVSWTLGVFICKAHKATMTMTTTASVFMLTVISIERFIAILYPFLTKRILTVQRLIGVVVAIWFLSCVISIPMFVFYELVPYLDESYCLAPDHFLDNGAKFQGTFMVLVCYLAPLLIMSVMYAKIGQGLWARSRTGNNPLTALPGRSSDKSKANLKVTYKRTKVVSSAEEKNFVPSQEGLRIHIGPQLSPPPGESMSAYSESEDTPHKTLLRNNSKEPSNTNIRDIPEMIGLFFIDEPDENENCVTEKEESNNTTVLWKSCNDIPLCSAGDKTIPAQCRIETEKAGTDSNGIGSHREMSKSENMLNTHQTGTSSDQSTSPDKAKVTKGIDKDPPKQLTSGRIHGGVKSHLSSNSEVDKRPVHRKYEPVATNQHSSPSGRGNPHSLSRQCLKKSPSKRKRNAEAVMHARRKVIRLLVVMVVCFAICLFPLQLMFVLTLFGDFSGNTIAGALVNAFSYLAYFINSAINPFLYAFLSDNFRSKMRETLFCGSSRARRQASFRQLRLKSVTSDAFTESELMPN